MTAAETSFPRVALEGGARKSYEHHVKLIFGSDIETSLALFFPLLTRHPKLPVLAADIENQHVTPPAKSIDEKLQDIK